MIYITLACQLGMSTEMVVKRMRAAAQEQGIDADIHATSLNQFIQEPGHTQVLLIGPQVKYQYEKAKQVCDPLGIPVGVIDTHDYGMMRGEKVLQQALDLINGK